VVAGCLATRQIELARCPCSLTYFGDAICSVESYVGVLPWLYLDQRVVGLAVCKACEHKI
jgi:hypothetical protein